LEFPAAADRLQYFESRLAPQDPSDRTSNWNTPAARRRLQDFAQTFDLFSYPLHVFDFDQGTSRGNGIILTTKLRKITGESVHNLQKNLQILMERGPLH
jgi:hypothetical protein